MNNINIILNSSHYDSTRKVFAYRLPFNEEFHNKKVGITYVSIYKQFENIKAEYNNNIITFTWIDDTVYTFTIPEGNYSITQINEYFQLMMVQNKLYCNLTDGGSNILSIVLFAELLENPTQYSAQINLFTVPDSASATTLNYILPTGATWAFPVSTISPTMTFNNAFGSLIGFTAGEYGNSATTVSLNSDITPQMAIVNTLLIRCNLVNTLLTNPSDVLGAMDLNGDYGSLLVKNIGQILYSNVSSNNFNEIFVYFSDQNFNKLSIKDTSVSIQLSIVDI